jgi:HK97 gp10 family phage protein
MSLPAITATIRGLPDLREALRSIPDKLRKRALRNALAAGARIIRDDARRATPVLSASDAIKAPFRTPGLVRKQIVVRTSKVARRRGDVGVFVNVKPAKKGLRGAKSKVDPFYWRWLEFGSKKLAATPFLQPAADRLPEALEVFKRKLAAAVVTLNNKGQTP